LTASDANVELITRLQQVLRSTLSTGGPWREAFEPFFELGVEYYPARRFPGAGHCHGLDELCGFMDQYTDAWENIDWQPLELTPVGDDRVLTKGLLVGEGRESGLRLDGEVFVCYWLRHGQIFRMEDHLTEQGARRALGLPADESG
jgi:hypothetical protein